MTDHEHYAILHEMSGTTFKAWFFLFRPWSYTATIIPFLVAACCGGRDTGCRWGHWVLGLVCGLFFQATVNLLNTWGDEVSGVDDAPGAIRTTPQVHDGLISLRAVLTAALACAAAAGLLGSALCLYRAHGDWHVNLPLLVAGFIGFLGATNYSTGIRFKYHGLGVPFVSFLMGPLEIFVAFALLLPEATSASVSRLASSILLPAGVLLALPIAALVGVILHGNDMRDIPSDRAAGIVTFASRLGPRRSLAYYMFCHALPALVSCLWFVALPILRTGAWHWNWAWLPLLAAPLSLRTVCSALHTYRAAPATPPWRGLERASGAVHLFYGTLYALSFALP